MGTFPPPGIGLKRRHRRNTKTYSVVQTAVAAYFQSKQLLLFAFARQY